MTAPEAARLPRCCAAHSDWTQLCEHLITAFPELVAADVITEVERARSAVVGFGISPEDQLDTGELVARHQLMLRSGQIRDNGRLDPETHNRRAVEVSVPVQSA